MLKISKIEWKSWLKTQITKIMASSPITLWQRDRGKMEIVADFIFLGFKITLDGDCSREIKTLASWKESYDKPRQYIKNRGITLLIKVHIVKAMVFPVVMYRCESRTIKMAEPQRIDAFELGTVEDSRESLGEQGDQTERKSTLNIHTDTEVQAPNLWPPDAKSWLIGKDPDVGKGRELEEKEATEDEMVGWHHWLKGHEFEQTPGDSEGQGSLVCCSPRGCKESDMT